MLLGLNSCTRHHSGQNVVDSQGVDHCDHCVVDKSTDNAKPH